MDGSRPESFGGQRILSASRTSFLAVHQGLIELLMSDNKLDVLLICECRQGIGHWAQKLEQLNCSCLFARNAVEVRALLENHSFPLVLSTRPITERSDFMCLLRRTSCIVFYSFPIEDGSLWFQALPEPSGRQPKSVLRPSEFISVLTDLIGRLRGDRVRLDSCRAAGIIHMRSALATSIQNRSSVWVASFHSTRSPVLAHTAMIAEEELHRQQTSGLNCCSI